MIDWRYLLFIVSCSIGDRNNMANGANNKALIFLCVMAAVSESLEDVRKAKTFVFLDIETSGLPAYNFGNVSITELAMWTSPRKDLEPLTNETNRPLLSKWSMFFNPARIINVQASEITGLYNDMLEEFNVFNENAGKAIISYLDHYPKPICLIAHNGNRFDFPIIKKSLEKVGLTMPDYILCADSLSILKEVDKLETEWLVEKERLLNLEGLSETEETINSSTNANVNALDENSTKLSENATNINELLDQNEDRMKERQRLNETTPRRSFDEKFKTTTRNGKSKARKELFPPTEAGNGRVAKTPRKSFKLGAIYERIFKHPPVVAHTAEADVETLHRIASKYGKEFIHVADKQAIPFSEIKTKT